jgi:hypothetical protein
MLHPPQAEVQIQTLSPVLSQTLAMFSLGGTVPGAGAKANDSRSNSLISQCWSGSLIDLSVQCVYPNMIYVDHRRSHSSVSNSIAEGLSK